jgi:hypothetical protein
MGAVVAGDRLRRVAFYLRRSSKYQRPMRRLLRGVGRIRTLSIT